MDSGPAKLPHGTFFMSTVQPVRKTLSCVSLAGRQMYISIPLSPSLQSISGITSPVQSVIFNNTENWIGAGSKSGVIKVFDLDENKSKVIISLTPCIPYVLEV